MSEAAGLAALATGIEAEKQSLRSYLKLAWETGDRSGKQMFIRLATDEFEHMRLLESWVQGRVPPVPAELNDIERLVPRLSDRSLRIRGASGQHQLSALGTALDLERSAREFYAAESHRAGSPELQQTFIRLAEMEAAHQALIQAELDSIQSDGFWFGLPEFSLEKER